jgi:hypothetical protein
MEMVLSIFAVLGVGFYAIKGIIALVESYEEKKYLAQLEKDRPRREQMREQVRRLDELAAREHEKDLKRQMDRL